LIVVAVPLPVAGEGSAAAVASEVFASSDPVAPFSPPRENNVRAGISPRSLRSTRSVGRFSVIRPMAARSGHATSTSVASARSTASCS
jgi:hypothetical protein